MSSSIIAATAQKIKAFNPSKFNTLVGLDGFVDNIIDVVDKRADAANYTRVETIAALGERISRAAGLSSNIELVVRQQKLGGNGPIMANALIENGLNVSYIGCLGSPTPHAVFSDMAARCKACYTLCEPGVTDALEFRDGKVMLGKHQTLKEVTYDRMKQVVGEERLEQLWNTSNLIALTNWTMLPYQTDIWINLLKDLKDVTTPKGAILFIDLADPEKRPADEIARACKMLKSFRCSHRVVLGVNQKESMEVSAALGLKFNADEIEANAATLRSALELDAVVIHPTKNAACATEKGSAKLDGPFCANPKLTTGAGDNFNSGFCIGLMAGLEPAELLAAGTASSGFYVRNAKSAKNTELAAFLEQWSGRFWDASF
ncbi:MAG TPA: PfkB family carbohydrate kinase [Planctomycetota bacterium]|nr:PfkB family carbohydrate kinase [Planctomycetota bacterium]